ncbi:hypothetical protein [Ilyobacter polytropus]|uniref:Uncharacterized protein n=1 Tax=Ilyobacter polytropus (strain ATCC 51220 / DSM 2926 / LMG 16218 / CuHBu1) TaxID=572544 RepID=E3H8B7_ILYPC|nr:hypothetical protein [Ilyobacter polytropus]ADO82684.1 hypothetical protein Ilyop_0899 [Ilyobacter polytropus DSM 2926]
MKNSGKLKKVLEDFGDLKERTRVEVSIRLRKNRKNFKENMLKEVKFRSFKYLDHIIFNNINKAKQKSILTLSNQLNKWRKEKGDSFRLNTFIEANKDIIYDYSLLREAIKNSYSNSQTAEKTYLKAKKYLLELEERDNTKYINNFKRIDDFKKQIKKEALKKPKNRIVLYGFLRIINGV